MKRSLPRDRSEAEGRTWSGRTAAAATFFLAWLTLQTAVPLVQLLQPGPRRLGWQMFSRVGHVRPQFALRIDGREVPVELERHVVHLRSEIELARALPPHLCRGYPRAEEVVIRLPDGPASSLECATVR